ncbi:MAG: glutamine-hydrolyzing carbamoyl-phosphate synthase small subunit [Anaerovoracaceae bacterium]|nr:glutamine-hydrolyzing carbamoyl-phosphate synthase small subunit [Anaerovoracaceae bacterium]
MEGLIYLEDGTVFKGKGFGDAKTSVGELVFNTSITGYQEILTDPSYKGQIINMTYPLIGNYGISKKDNESFGIHAFGLVIKDLCEEPFNSMSVKTMDQWLKEQHVPGVYGIDTRQITRKIRKSGTIKCLISTEGISIAEAKQLCEEGSLRGDWMKTVSVKEKTVMEPDGSHEGEPYNVAVIDFGVKGNILRSLLKRNCRLTVFPYGSTAEEIMEISPDGILLTNGPGDPEEASEAIEEVRKLIGCEIPMFGICMGHQILALAMGGRTYKLKYGHRGGNHGVYDKDTKRSYITSQNHGFAVQHESIILKGMEVTHLNLNDGTVEGMEHRDLPVFSVQFHPEAAPGPTDSAYLFDKFMDMMKSYTGR